MIRPPYSKEFVQLFLPLIDNEALNAEKSVQDFISYSKANNLTRE